MAEPKYPQMIYGRQRHSLTATYLNEHGSFCEMVFKQKVEPLTFATEQAARIHISVHRSQLLNDNPTINEICYDDELTIDFKRTFDDCVRDERIEQE